MADNRIPNAWCSDCRATASRQCWDKHDVHNTRAALRRNLQGALSEAAGLLEGLQDQVKGEQALQALALLSGESWGLTLRGGDQVLAGTVRNTDDPLVKALWVVVAARAALVQHREAATGPPATPGPSTGGERPVLREANAFAISQTVKAEEQEENGPAVLCEANARAISQPAISDKGEQTGQSVRREPSPVEARAILRRMNVSKVSQNKAALLSEEGVAVLQRARGVGSLVGVYCQVNPLWSLELLQRATPTLRKLSVRNPRPNHMHAIHAMPRLRRLQVECSYNAVSLGQKSDKALVLPALPPGHRGLQWLRVKVLPRDTLKSLLQAHAHSLQELQLLANTVTTTLWPAYWPSSGADLQSLQLEQCGLRALRRVVLQRAGRHHSRQVCAQQLAEMRRMLPEAEVLCELCENLQPETL